MHTALTAARGTCTPSGIWALRDCLADRGVRARLHVLLGGLLRLSLLARVLEPLVGRLLERVKVAAVGGHLAAVEVDHIGGHLVQEVARMGDNHQRFGPAAQGRQSSLRSQQRPHAGQRQQHAGSQMQYVQRLAAGAPMLGSTDRCGGRLHLVR